MATPWVEDAIDPVDGSRTIFYTTYPYRPGSVRVFLNGQLHTQQRDDGWVEMGSKKVRLKEAPRIGDVVAFYYLLTV